MFQHTYLLFCPATIVLCFSTNNHPSPKVARHLYRFSPLLLLFCTQDGRKILTLHNVSLDNSSSNYHDGRRGRPPRLATAIALRNPSTIVQVKPMHSQTNNPFLAASSPQNTSTNAISSFQLRSDPSADGHSNQYQQEHHQQQHSALRSDNDDSQLRTRQPRTFDPSRHISVVSQDLEPSSGLIRNFLLSENAQQNQPLVGDNLEQGGSGGQSSSPIKANLWNPHMLCIPSPGSGIAFHNSNHEWARKLFRSLPTLDDVLARRSEFPLCLYHYFSYLRDAERCENILEFWLDLSAHEELCRLYVKQLDYNIPNSSQNHVSVNDRSSSDPDVGMAEPILPLYYVSKRILESNPNGNVRVNVDQFNFDITNDPHLTEVSRQTALAGTGPSPRCNQHSFCQAPWPSLAIKNEKHIMEVSHMILFVPRRRTYTTGTWLAVPLAKSQSPPTFVKLSARLSNRMIALTLKSSIW